MRKLLASLIIGTLGVVSVNTQAATTNLLQTISANFTIYSQGPTISGHGTTSLTVSKQSFKSSDIINKIAKDAGISVSKKASLDLVSEVVVESTTTTYKTNSSGKITTNTVVTLGHTGSGIAIVDGSTITPVDSYLTIVPTQTTLEASTTNPQGDVTSDTKYNIYTFTLKTTTISFAATGFGILTLEPVKEFGTSFNLNEGDLALAGNGVQGSASTLVLVSGTASSSFGGVIVVK